MVKITFCDRCKKELKRKEKWEGIGFDFDGFFEDASLGDISELKVNGEKIKILKKILKCQLCQSCISGYNEIIDKANKEIRKYLKEKSKEKNT